MLVELHNVSKCYGPVQALAGLSAEIQGEVIGLLGPNGAGKSTLLKCLLGLIPHEGEAVVLGMRSRDNSFRIRDRVGYMPEMDSYLPGMNAVELCAYAAELSGLPPKEAMQRAHDALFYAGLEDKRYQRVDGYSTGMKQRVKLAQALVHDPDMLFLDEPTNGLDPRAREEMLDLIAALPERRGCVVILSTHLLHDVERICDHAVILHRGALRFCGSIDGLRGQDTRTRVFEIEVKQDPGALARDLRAQGCEVSDAGGHAGTVAPSSALHLTVSVPESVAPADKQALFLLSRARAAGVQIRGMQDQRETLESAFLRAVGTARGRPEKRP